MASTVLDAISYAANPRTVRLVAVGTVLVLVFAVAVLGFAVAVSYIARRHLVKAVAQIASLFALAAWVSCGAWLAFSASNQAQNLAAVRVWQAEQLGGLPASADEAHWFGTGGPTFVPGDVDGDRANQISAAGAAFYTGQAEESFEATIGLTTGAVAAVAIAVRKASKLRSS